MDKLLFVTRVYFQSMVYDINATTKNGPGAVFVLAANHLKPEMTVHTYVYSVHFT